MDVTAILNESGEQLFSTATIISASTSPSNTFSSHTIEDSTVVIDNKIINQTRISMTLILNSNDYQEVYKTIQSASINATQLSIQTRVSTFNNMYIEAYPSEESASMYDTISLAIDFVEQIIGSVVVQKLSSVDVSNPSDVDTTSRGEQLPKEDKQTTLQQIAGAFS